MAWASCPTHGPIQDADVVKNGEAVVRLVCVCGLECSAYEPQSFVEHEELVDLALSHRQPAEDHDTPEAPLIGETGPEEIVALGGGWYQLPDGSKVQGLGNAEGDTEE